MEITEDEIIQKMLKNVSTAIETLYYHMNKILLASHADIM